MTDTNDRLLPRREALAAIAAAGAVLTTGCGASAQDPAASPNTAQTAGGADMTQPRALAGAHTPVPLPFDARSLEGLSERLITSHHENNYGGAVRNLNRVEQELAGLGRDAPGFVAAALHERELTFRNSKTLHEAYFGNLGGDGRVAGAIESAIAQAYGATASWEQAFRAAAMGLGGGSGWVVLSLELDTGALRNVASQGHPQALATSVPLLVLDMYEHSYHVDYGAQHAHYVDAFFRNVSWEEVDRRYQRAERASAALRESGG